MSVIPQELQRWQGWADHTQLTQKYKMCWVLMTRKFCRAQHMYILHMIRLTRPNLVLSCLSSKSVMAETVLAGAATRIHLVLSHSKSAATRESRRYTPARKYQVNNLCLFFIKSFRWIVTWIRITINMAGRKLWSLRAFLLGYPGSQARLAIDW